MGSEFFDGHEFLIDAKPVREQETHEHQCVCLLLHGTPADIAATGGRRDKCQQMVVSPDQAFCDDCENQEHHLADNQYGEARNIHRKGKNA